MGSALSTYLFAVISEQHGWNATVLSWVAVSGAGLLLTFGCIAFAGVAGNLQRKYHWNELASWLGGAAAAGLGRFICHVLSGVVFFAEYAEGSGLSPMVYSLSYNSFVFVDIAICLVVIAFPQVRKALARMAEKTH